MLTWQNITPKITILVHLRLFILFFIFWKQLAFGDHSSIYLEVSNPKNMSRKSNCSHRTSNSEKKIMHNMKIGSKFLIFPIIIDCWRKTTNLSNKRLLAESSPDSGTSLDQFFGRFHDVLCEYQTSEEKKTNCSSLARITRKSYVKTLGWFWQGLNNLLLRTTAPKRFFFGPFAYFFITISHLSSAQCQ